MQVETSLRERGNRRPPAPVPGEKASRLAGSCTRHAPSLDHGDGHASAAQLIGSSRANHSGTADHDPHQLAPDEFCNLLASTATCGQMTKGAEMSAPRMGNQGPIAQ